MEDLIHNVHILFDESPSQSAPIPSSNVAETTSAYTHGSLSLTPALPQSTTRHHSGLVDDIPTSSQLFFSSLPSDATTNRRPTPPQVTLLSPLLGLSSSQVLTEGVETTAQEQVAPGRAATAAEHCQIVHPRMPSTFRRPRLSQSGSYDSRD